MFIYGTQEENINVIKAIDLNQYNIHNLFPLLRLFMILCTYSEVSNAYTPSPSPDN